MPKRFVFNNEEYFWHNKFNKHQLEHFVVKGLKISHCYCGAWWIDDIPAEDSDKLKLLEETVLYKIIRDYVRQIK